ncbi:DgyrCDS14772 [Dimorphilus gyrociliatus]|uniref:DgyrCDS14772 n=1 Tax=Dimorphilus gyrociliatus TaxID=2664684 RepID=A0A7I8WES5_9ANNE|nr:DgyrCDS14772 [Dimorphilus gyrociliatus]
MERKLLIICLIVCLSLHTFSLDWPGSNLISILEEIAKREELENMLRDELFEKRENCYQACKHHKGRAFFGCMKDCSDSNAAAQSLEDDST